MKATKDRVAGPSWVINGRFLAQRMTGVQRYAYEIVRALDDILSESAESEERPAFQLVTPSAAENIPILSNIGLRRTRFGSGHLWDQFVLPFYGREGVLGLGNFGPFLTQHQIVCIHDANTFILPESYSRSFALAYRTLLPIIGKRARRVATVSSFSADMLVKYGICEREKIFIAPNGHEHVLRWDAKRARVPLIARLSRPYILLLGSNAKHKNVDMILEQAQALDEHGIEIVTAGGDFNIFAADAPTARQPNMHHVGFVGDDELAALYEGALCLVFPSRTEGFGIPLLEAMAKGCPVISSNAASLIEVGGDAAIYVHPDNNRGWRDAIVALSRNEALRADMAERGRRRANRFTWRRSAGFYLQEILNLSWKRRS